MATAIDIDRDTIEKAYDRWAPVYDLVFGAGVRARPAAPRSTRPSASAAASSKSASAPAFRCRTTRRDNRMFGVDISEPMLRKAQERVDRARPRAMSKASP